MFPGTPELWDRLRHYFASISDLVDEALARAEESE